MRSRHAQRFTAAPVAMLVTGVHALTADPRLREHTYYPKAVVTVPTKRGEVTLSALAPDEHITSLTPGWEVIAPDGNRLGASPPSRAAKCLRQAKEWCSG